MQEWNNPPDLTIDSSKNYLVTMETNRGTIELELYPEHAPVTVNNFVFLINESFYDGVTFHRVIADFMIQGGDPTGTGSRVLAPGQVEPVQKQVLAVERNPVHLGACRHREGDAQINGTVLSREHVFQITVAPAAVVGVLEGLTIPTASSDVGK